MSAPNLDTFITSSRPVPQPLAISQEIRDRGSTFLGHIFRVNNPEDASRTVKHVRNVLHGSKRATHEIAAWRCMVLKSGKSGLGGPEDFELRSGSEDDGEKYAGERVLRTMRSEGAMDAVVIISRWYGGEMLGPVRFSHIEKCAREVCRTFRQKEDMEECITTLTSLDDILATLRAELALSTSTARKDQDYGALLESLDTKRAKRLIAARENSIKAVKLALQKCKEGTAEPRET
ncbi:ribosomal protein S5 domain 2-like protein [Cristinia sonorae]|uniref:Ribosomal protein S5 domain 2-like protein n=1 Tax=Cristinia sonorae TaxID=1940300 RepID=A0A8K0XLA2_9AGAR|nr:ribosomal protein S5 domain 2-like protein [Cristinia sonorae]